MTDEIVFKEGIANHAPIGLLDRKLCVVKENIPKGSMVKAGIPRL